MTYFGIKLLVKAMDPTNSDKKSAEIKAREMLKKLGVKNVKELTAYELCMAANLVDPLSIDVQWNNIGGLSDIIQNIQETVILPFNRPDLFQNSSLLQAPKGVLLYGPPGCGKTMLAKATAKGAGARFINLQISSLVDKWYGESQKRAEAIFSLAMKLQPCIIFIDEIDSFLRSRTSTDHEATVMIKTQFMSFWDGLITNPSCQVMVMGATNRPQDVDAAILRRMPSMFHVGLPGKKQRENIIRLILSGENVDDDIEYNTLAEHTESFSGSDLREICRAAAVSVAHEFIRSSGFNSESEGMMRGINMKDLESATKKVRQTKSLSTSSPLNFHLD
ncbi:hypothetical protein LOTGIDRAFT_177773 [Lottia gigantea]|uniref:AAA+ ATPase domain-containing protein n=1 Tax=Lottia gigantea TaxID=225164 RepID=V4B0V2_LOTGI|nr:hypothetical protein LOTGIDRAFT_177773 [Lottia gigantea]ESP03873.1 hypothetical protein LOTGIDRAFT_177773 [Lottia gigantea]